MSPIVVGIIGIILLFVLLGLRMQIGFAMALVGFLGFFVLNSFEAGVAVLGIQAYRTAAHYTLSVIPLFLLMGQFANHSKMGSEVYDMLYRWIGSFPGGLSMATVGACACFAAISGSSLATAAMFGTIALPEMQKISGLDFPPLFTPIVGGIYKGMGVFVPLHSRLLCKPLTAAEMCEHLAAYYAEEAFVEVYPYDPAARVDNGFFNPMAANDTNKNDIFVFGHDDQILLVSRLDNLGKGASGAAVQNMNIMLGLDEGTGLR